jgi:hypothetical protein
MVRRPAGGWSYWGAGKTDGQTQRGHFPYGDRVPSSTFLIFSFPQISLPDLLHLSSARTTSPLPDTIQIDGLPL